MNIDPHVHLLIDKDAAPRFGDLHLVAAIARSLDLDMLCITEHLDATMYLQLLEGLFERPAIPCRRLGDGLIALENGLMLSSGAEVALRGGGDVGVHAAPQVLRSLAKGKGAYDLEELLEALDQIGAPYTIVAHHLLAPGKWIESIERLASRVDAVEVPGKDPTREQPYRSLATRLGRPTTSSSDSHTWTQLGVGRIVVSESFVHSPEAGWLRRALQAGATESRVSSSAAERVTMSRLYREHLRRSATEHMDAGI